MKPYVICHMCTTIDGRIISSRWSPWMGAAAAGRLFETTAASFGVGAWLVGTTTMREFAARDRRLPRARLRVARIDHLAAPRARRLAIGTDARGVLRFERPQVDGDHVVLLVSERVGDDYLAHLRSAGVSYLFCGREQVDVRLALDKLARRLGVRRLMLEGGGTFNGAVLGAGLVDQISQVILPVVDGGRGIATLFDIPGKPPRRAAAGLRLIRHRALPGGAHWFRWQVLRRSRAAAAR